jgi:hypothetical protein
MNGTVTIALKDFDELREAHDKATELKENTIRAAREVEVFLSFLLTRENFQDYVAEFNTQSTKSTIVIEGGRAKIQFNEKT